MIAVTGILLIVIGIFVARLENDLAAVFTIVFWIAGLGLLIWGLSPLLELIK